MQTPSDTLSQSPQHTKQNSSLKTKGHALAASNRILEIEELDAAIGKINHGINAANYELMVLIREFDERAGWLKWGYTHALDWLMWSCDLSAGAARDKLRIAHALKELPLISVAFSTGKLSYTKVRAITRIATEANEAELIDMAMRMTARHVEEHCKQRSNTQKDSTAIAKQAHEKRDFRVWRDHARGTVHFSIELADDEGELIENAVQKAAVKLSCDSGSAARLPEETISWGAQQVDALVSFCRSFLDGGAVDFGVVESGSRSDSHDSKVKPDSNSDEKTSTSTADHYQVVVHVDEAALAGNETGTSQLPIESVRRLCCDGSIVPLVENEAGEPLNAGRKVRIVTTAIRRALWARDKGCGFPGCSHKRFVDAHHIKHWADGGETSVENMVLLCSNHHKLVHEGGYSVQRDHSGELFFRRPDGKAVPHCGYRMEDQIDEFVDDLIDDNLDWLFNGLKNSQEFIDDDGLVIKEAAAVYCVRTSAIESRQRPVLH